MTFQIDEKPASKCPVLEKEAIYQAVLAFREARKQAQDPNFFRADFFENERLARKKMMDLINEKVPVEPPPTTTSSESE